MKTSEALNTKNSRTYRICGIHGRQDIRLRTDYAHGTVRRSLTFVLAFDFAIGGGHGHSRQPKVAIKAGQFDYILTRFGTNFTGGNNNQSNFRFQAGMQFRF